MADVDLLLICVAGLTVTFTVLIFLAACMRGLTYLFPARPAVEDAALVAAITSAAAAAHPGMRVTRIVEDS